MAFAGPANTAGNAAVVKSAYQNSYLFHLSGFAVKAGQTVPPVISWAIRETRVTRLGRISILNGIYRDRSGSADRH